MNTNAIQFQRAQEVNVDQLIALEKLADSKVYAAVTNRNEVLDEMKKSIIYFVKRNDRIVGSVWYELKDVDHAYLSGLVVDPQFQGQGIGRAILEKLLNEDLKSIRRIDLVTHPANSSAVIIYVKLGFVIEGWKENVFEDGGPRIVLALNR